MLFSLNLSLGYNAGRIIFEQPIRYSSQMLTNEQRVRAKWDSIDVTEKEHVRIVDYKIAYLGTFDAKTTAL